MFHRVFVKFNISLNGVISGCANRPPHTNSSTKFLVGSCYLSYFVNINVCLTFFLLVIHVGTLHSN